MTCINSIFDKSDIVSIYSRASAIADGILIDITETAAERGFSIPVAITCAAWVDCVEWDEACKKIQQDESGRLWDVVHMAYVAVSDVRNKGFSRVDFEIFRVPAHGRGLSSRLVRLVVQIGPGDTGAPVLTIMQPDES